MRAERVKTYFISLLMEKREMDIQEKEKEKTPPRKISVNIIICWKKILTSVACFIKAFSLSFLAISHNWLLSLEAKSKWDLPNLNGIEKTDWKAYLTKWKKKSKTINWECITLITHLVIMCHVLWCVLSQ